MYAVKRPVTSRLFQPAPGNEFVAIDAEECAPEDLASGKSVRANPYDFSLVVSDNPMLLSTVDAVEPGYHATSLSHGVCVRGWITFEVRKDASVKSVVFQAPFTGPPEFVTLKWTVAS